ncbi:hypothetical protein KUCAC02_033605 [Chaenocephalus aceratus]|nr:hypothetical protein KUCAC02_033605 [Chaenocephalus aceratus]
MFLPSILLLLRILSSPPSPPVSYEIMHSCWSPVPKCRPSFQHLIGQVEALGGSLSPAPPLKEPLLYVNLEEEPGGGCGADGGVGCQGEGMEAGNQSWSIPWQIRAEEEEKDWLMVASEVALAIGGDYRYIIGPCGAPEDEEEEGSGNRGDTLQEEGRDEEEDDAVINV